jgi:hypothetical protein
MRFVVVPVVVAVVVVDIDGHHDDGVEDQQATQSMHVHEHITTPSASTSMYPSAGCPIPQTRYAYVSACDACTHTQIHVVHMSTDSIHEIPIPKTQSTMMMMDMCGMRTKPIRT